LNGLEAPLKKKNYDRVRAEEVSCGFSHWRHRFNPRRVFVAFVVNQVALRQFFLEFFGFALLVIIPLVLHLPSLIWGNCSGSKCEGTLSLTTTRERKQCSIQNCTTYKRGRSITSRLFSCLKFTAALNSALLFWKLLVFDFLFGISKTFLCSMSALLVKTILLLDALQILMFLGTQLHLGT
jgi:hypothetical protein